MTYKIVRHYFASERQTIKSGLTLEEAQAHCNDLETSSATCTTPQSIQITERNGSWFDSYEKDG